jgi:type III pantothenate kinase
VSRPPFPLIAVDVGNSRVKLGLFERPSADGSDLPAPARTLDLVPGAGAFDRIPAWLAGKASADFDWWIGSVQRNTSSNLVDWLRSGNAERIRLLTSRDLPLKVEVPRPDMVGIDRLLGAVSANRLREAGRPAIVVDLGTAVTLDVVSANGAFLGGAILPGIAMSARALHEFTDLLPLLDMHALAEPPEALGTDTFTAMRSGIYYGAIGGVRQLLDLLGSRLPGEPQVFLTGGAAPAVAPLISAETTYVGHLVLAGIALAAQ